MNGGRNCLCGGKKMQSGSRGRPSPTNVGKTLHEITFTFLHVYMYMYIQFIIILHYNTVYNNVRNKCRSCDFLEFIGRLIILSTQRQVDKTLFSRPFLHFMHGGAGFVRVVPIRSPDLRF